MIAVRGIACQPAQAGREFEDFRKGASATSRNRSGIFLETAGASSPCPTDLQPPVNPGVAGLPQGMHTVPRDPVRMQTIMDDGRAIAMGNWRNP